MKKSECLEVLDIIRALWDKNEHGENLTSIMFDLDYRNVDSGEIMDRIETHTTSEPMVTLADIGGYTTIRLTYKYNSSNDFKNLRRILEKFSNLMTDYIHGSDTEKGIPCLHIEIWPSSLPRAMILAVNPVFYNIQPHDPMYNECNELQLLFVPESVSFYDNTEFDEKTESGKARSEMISEQLTRQDMEQKEKEKREYLEEHEKEMQQQLSERYGVHGNHAIQKAYHGYGKDREN